MFYDTKLLCVRRNGPFSKCWLAATNPKEFRHLVKRTDLEKIKVLSLCDRILTTINTSSTNPQKRFSLYLAAQLSYGTICIYQQQVHFLYENVAKLISMQSFYMFQPEKRKHNDPNEKKNKKVKRTNLNVQIIKTVTTTREIIVAHSDGAIDTNIQLNDAITLREEGNLQINMSNEDFNGFGPLTEEERLEFLDTFGDIPMMNEPADLGQATGENATQQDYISVVDNEIIPISNQRDPPIPAAIMPPPTTDNTLNGSNIDAVPMDIDDDLTYGLPRHSSQENNPLMNLTGIIEPVMDVEMADITLMPDMLDETLNIPVEENQNENVQLDEAEMITTEQEPVSVKRAKQRKLIIDEVTIISTKRIKNNLKNSNTMRCAYAEEDVVTTKNLYNDLEKYMFTDPIYRLDNLTNKIKMGAFNYNLLENFYRTTKTKPATNEIDKNLLIDIFQNRLRLSQINNNTQTIEIVEGFINTHMLIFFEDERNSLKLRSRSQIVEQNSPILLPNMPQESANVTQPELELLIEEQPLQQSDLTDLLAENELPFLEIIPENLAKNIVDALQLTERERTNYTEETSVVVDEMFQLKRREMREKWGVEGVLKILMALWCTSTHPIDMSVLCRTNKSRKCAALAFHSILELYAPRINLIQIEYKPNTMEIGHISKSSKLIELLQEGND